MKIKKFLSLMLLALVGILLVACGETAEDPAKIAAENLDKVAITYATGDSATSVTADVTLGKVELEGLTVEWASDNAAITKEGKVTRPAAGEKDVTVKLTVKVTYKDAEASKDFELVVKALPEVKPLSVEIQGTDALVTGAEYTFTVTVLPENANNKAVVWSSDAEAVATVDANGKVKAVAPGTANITAKCAANETIAATFAVTVADPTADTVAATQAKAAGETGWCKGVVVGVYKQGYFISDGTAGILVYMNKTEFTQKVGDYVEVKGTLVEKYGAKQFTADATVTAAEGTAPEVSYKAEKLKDAASVTAFMDALELFKKVTFRVTVTKASASYVNCVVKDSEVAVSLTYPMDYTAYTAGKDYDVTAYALYTSVYNNVNTLYVMVEKATEVDYGYDVKITYKDGEASTDETINSLLFPVTELKTPEAKDGYVFLGWYTAADETAVKVYSVDTPADVTLFAKWVAEADAPLFVDPACEDGSAYTTISAAVAAAKEGQEIYLAPGDYTEEVTTLAARVYADAAAVAEVYITDFNTTTGKTVTAATLDTNYIDSSDMTTMLNSAEMTAKWTWLYDALVAVAENDDMAVATCDKTNGSVKGFYLANLCGFFTGTNHKDTHLSYQGEDFSNPALVTKVMQACAKVDETAEDTVANKIIVNKTVKFVGPNANIKGQAEGRNEEANVICNFVIAADNVVVDGLAFTADGTVEVDNNNVVIKNCYVATSVYGHGTADNRMGMIYGGPNEISNLTVKDSYLSAAGTSYTSELMAFGANVNGFTLEGCYLQNTATGTLPTFEGILWYRCSGVFNIKNNETHFGTDGYLFWFGYYNNSCTQINIEDNIFANNGELYTVTIGFRTLSATEAAPLTINVYGNEFIDFAPSTFVLGTTGTGAAFTTFNYYYNFFDGQESFKISNGLGVKVNHDYNCTLGEIATGNAVAVLEEEHTLATNEEVKAMYALYKGEVKTAETDSTITFDTDGGNTIEPLKYKDYSKVVLPTPTKAGHKFVGWYKTVEDKEVKVAVIFKYEDITLKAHWEQLYTLTFDVDGGDAIDPINFIDYTKVEFPTPTKKNATFLGWYIGETAVTKLTENADVTIKAAWHEWAELEVGADKTYTTIAAAIAAASNGDIIKIAAGTYAESFTIDKNVTITSADPENKAELTGVITLGTDLDNVVVSNLKFTGAAQVVAAKGGTRPTPVGDAKFNVKYFEFSGNVVETAITTGAFIDGTQNDKTYSKYVIKNNTFKAAAGFAGTGVILMYNQYDLEVVGNTFEGFTVGKVVDVEDTDSGKGLTGDFANVSNNTFKNITGNAIHMNWIGKLATYLCTYNFNSNTFENVSGVAFTLHKTNNSEAGVVINVNYNVLKNVGSGFKVTRLVPTITFNAKYNVFVGEPSTAFFTGTNENTGKANGEKLLIVNAEETEILAINDAKVAAWATASAVASYADFLDGCEKATAAYDYAVPGFINASAVDNAAIAANNPTLLVNALFAAGKTYKIGGKDYAYGTASFATLDEAIAAATDTDIIYLYAGDYTVAGKKIEKKLTIVGPNYDKNAYAERNAEAIITLVVCQVKANLAITGCEITYAGNGDMMHLYNGSNEVVLANCYLYNANSIIRTKEGTHGLVKLQDCKIEKVTQFIFWAQAGSCDSFVMTGCNYFDGGVCSGGSNGRIRTNGAATIINNTFNLTTWTGAEKLFGARGSDSAFTVSYNTFKANLTDLVEGVAGTSTGLVTFTTNLFLDAEGTVITDITSLNKDAAPGKAVAGTAAASAEALAEAYALSLN